MLRPKAIRRLVMLVAAATAAMASVTWLWRANEASRILRLERTRSAGMTAYTQKQYETAVKLLDPYVRQEGRDVEALLALAESRLRVETPDGRHLDEASRLYRRMHELRPESRVAKLALLDIAVRTADPELLTLAEEVLADNPAQPQALAARSEALARQGLLDQALQDARRYAELVPQDLRSHRRVLSLMAARREPSAAVLAYADYAAEGSSTARRKLLLALGHEAAGKLIEARDLLTEAATTLRQAESIDVDLARTLADELDRFFSDVDHIRPNASIDLLRELAVRAPQQELLVPLTRRLALAGDFDTALWWAEHGLDHAAPGSRASFDLTPLRAWCLYELGRTQAASTLVVTDSAWADALVGRFAPGPELTQRDRREQLGRAISRNPMEPVFRLWLADAWRELGEVDFALTHYRMAAARETWADPHLRSASLLLEMNRPRDARAAARRALELAAEKRTVREARVLSVLASAPLVSSPADISALRDTLVELTTVHPEVAGRLAPTHAMLLAQLDLGAEAAAVVRSASQQSLTPEERVALSNAAERYDLADPIEVLRGDSAVSPQVAYALAVHTRSERALIGLDPSHPSSRLAEVRLRTLFSGPNPRAWAALGDAFPEDLTIQQALLAEAPLERMDRAVLERTIDRLHKLTGDQATGWRLAKARLLLDSQRMPDLIEAATLLIDLVRADPRRVDTRLLLVNALDLTGNRTSSLQHLAAAADLDPPDPTANLRLIDRLLPLARYGEVRKHALRLAAENPAEPAVRIRLGRLLLDAGLFDTAVDLLASLPNDAAAVELRAQACFAAGRADAALALLETLPATPSPGIVSDAALLAALAGDADLSDRLLERLGEGNVSPPEAWLARAERRLQAGDAGGARAVLDEAVERFADSPAVHVARAGLELRLGDADAAARFVDAALAKFPNDKALTSLEQQGHGITGLGQWPPDEDTPTEMLADLAAARPFDAPVQALLVRRLQDEGVPERGVRLAQTASLACVQSAAIALAGAEAASSARLWAPALALAERTLQRNGPVVTTILAATAEIRLGDAEAAVQRLRSTTDLPDELRLPVLAEGLVANGQRSDAAALLAPHLDDASWARLAWLEAGATGADAVTLSHWIGRIEQRIDTANVHEQRALAAARVELGRLTADAAPIRQAMRELSALPTTDPATQFVTARLHLYLGELDDAERLYRQLLQDRPRDPAVANDLAIVLLRRREPAAVEAMSLAERAVQVRPTSAVFLETLARSEWAAGHVESARRSFERSLAFDPTYADALSGLAKLEREHPSAEGRSDQLLRQLTDVLQDAAPPDPVLEREIDRLVEGQMSVVQ